MTTSGTYTFNPSNGELVLSAFARIQLHYTSLVQHHFQNARQELNYLMVELGNLQPNLWKVVQNSVTLSAGTALYTLPTNIVMILDSWITQNSGSVTSQTDRYITLMSRSEYAALANKNTPGAPTQLWFDRLVTPTVTFYPTPDNNGPYVYNYFAALRMQDANLPGGETLDIQYLFTDCVVAGLAHRMARIYAPQLEAQREKDYDKAWKIAASQNTEGTNLSLSPAVRAYYRR